MAGTGDARVNAMTVDAGGARDRHRYFACLGDGTEPIPFSPPDFERTSHPDARYFARVLAEMEPRLARDRLTFYLTWDVRQLPSYGPDVVAVVVGDEAARIPPYFHRIGATFKGHGSRPTLGVARPGFLSSLGGAAALELLEKQLIGIPGVINRGRQAIRARSLRPPRLPGVFPIPLGYFQQVERPLIPILARPVDVFFAGSVQHFVGGNAPLARRLIPSAKVIARKQMLDGLDAARRQMPDLRIDLSVSRGFADPEALSPERYSDRLMAARICLAPRGNAPETLRAFEGMRIGSVVLCDPLPRRHWFYRGAPVVQVEDWRRLPDLLAEILSDADGLEQRHQAALSWWRERCGEEAVGAYMADRINRFVAV